VKESPTQTVAPAPTPQSVAVPPIFVPSSHPALRFQRAAGNRAMQSLLQARAIQAKLTINPPGDDGEREADFVAETVTHGASQGATSRPVQSQVSDQTADMKDLKPPGSGSPVHPLIRTRVESLLGTGLGSVRVHDDPVAQEAADQLHARAFTHRNHIWLGPNQSLSNLTLMAHELTHVAQQSRTPPSSNKVGGLESIQRDTEVPTSSGSDTFPIMQYTALDWIGQFGSQMMEEVIRGLDTTPFTLPVPEMRWGSSTGNLIRSLLAPFRNDPGAIWLMFPKYLLPDSLADAVNIGRDCYPSPYGMPLWKPGVVSEVTRRLLSRVVESIGRVAPRVARHLARNWTPAALTNTTIPSPPPTAGTLLPTLLQQQTLIIPFGPQSIPAGLAFSHPIDPYVYAALRQNTYVDAVRYRAAHPEEFTAAAAAADERPLRAVQFEWMAAQQLPSWIRVTQPNDATIEEVANTLYGEATGANRLIASPPMFGIPREDLPTEILGSVRPTVLTVDLSGRRRPEEPTQQRSALLVQHQLNLIDAMRRAGINPSEVTATTEAQILSSPLGDQAALGAAARIMPTPGANKALIMERLGLIFNNLGDMLGIAGDLARPPDAPAFEIIFNKDTGSMTRERFVAPETHQIRGRIVDTRGRVEARVRRFTDASDAEAIQWDGQSRGQLEIVTTVLNGLRIAGGLAVQFRGWPNIYNLIRSTAEGYVDAVVVSDMYPAARARLDIAERHSVLFPVVALELWLAQIRMVLDEARSSEMTTVKVDTGSTYVVSDMDKMEQELRDRLARVRAQLLQNPRAAQSEVKAIFDEVSSLQTGASLALNLDTVDRVWQELYDSLSVMGALRSIAPGRHGNDILSDAMDSAHKLNREWHEILMMWRYGDRGEAQKKLREKADGEEWKTWVKKMEEIISDHRFWDRLMTFIIMVGIAVLSGGIGAYVEGAVGAAWGVGAGASVWVEAGAATVGVLTEATAFTVMSYPLTTRDPSLGDFGGQLGQNILFFGGGRVLARGFTALIGEARAATIGGKLATTGVVTTAFVGANLVMANAQAQQTRGRGLTGGEATEIGLENVAFVGATALANALLRRPLANLRLSGELTGLNFRHIRAMQALDATMREVTFASELSQTLRHRLIGDTQRAVLSEHALADRIRAIVESADASVDKNRPETEQARDRQLARFGISAELAGQVRSGAVQSQVQTGLRAMQGIRISRAMEPVGSDFLVRGDMYQETLGYFRSLPETMVTDSAHTFVLDLSATSARMEPGGESFLVQPKNEAPFRVYKRAPGAVGEIGGRVELAGSVEEAAGARDPMARPEPPAGSRATIRDIDWGYARDATEGVRQALLQRGDIGAVERSMREAGVPASNEQLRAVKNYLFNSKGISFDRANYEAWQRLASGRAPQVRDVAFLVHELAEIRALEQIRTRTGFDYRGIDFDRMSGPEQQRWHADFNRYYLQAHSEALAAEYRYVADAVSLATKGRVRIGRNIAAAVDPTRGEARENMMVEGRPLSQHPDFKTWQARGSEIVEIGAGTQERLRLPTRTPTLAELVGAVKRGGGPPENISVGGRGRTGATAGDARVDSFLDTLDANRAQRFRDSGHATALRNAPAVVDFLTRPGELNVAPFEQFIVRSTLGPEEAIPLLNALLAGHPTMTREGVINWTTAIRGRWAVAPGDASTPITQLRAAVELSREARYAAQPERAVTDLRALMADNVELRVAYNELTRESEFGDPETATVAGPRNRGPDVRLTFSGGATEGREMYSTDLTTPASASEADARNALGNGLMRGIRDKAVDYTRPGVPAFTRRVVAVQVRPSTEGYNFDRSLTEDFLNGVMQRMRANPDTTRASAQDTLDRVVFYDSRGEVAYVWNR